MSNYDINLIFLLVFAGVTIMVVLIFGLYRLFGGRPLRRMSRENALSWKVAFATPVVATVWNAIIYGITTILMSRQ